MFGCQPNIISPDKDLKAVLEFLGSESSKLTNCRIYYARQMYFKTGKIPSRSDLHKVLVRKIAICTIKRSTQILHSKFSPRLQSHLSRLLDCSKASRKGL